MKGFWFDGKHLEMSITTAISLTQILLKFDQHFFRARLGYGTECSSGPSSTSANRKPVDLGSNLANLDFETGSEGEEEDETDAESNPTFSRQTR